MSVDASNIILGQAGDGDKFTIKWHGLRLKLEIKPVTASTLIKISREVAMIKDIDPEASMFSGLLENADSLWYVCRAIAIATGARFPGFRASVISTLEAKDIKHLWNILVKQSDPQSFFFIIISAKGMNKMKSQKQAKSKAGKHSSEDSQ